MNAARVCFFCFFAFRAVVETVPRARLTVSAFPSPLSSRCRANANVANAKREREGKTEVRPLADPPRPAAPRAAAVGFRRRGRMKETTTRDGTPPRGGAEGCFPG